MHKGQDGWGGMHKGQDGWGGMHKGQDGWGGMHKGQDIVNKFGSKNKYFSTECEILKTLLSLSMIHKPNTVCYMNSMMC